MNRVINFRFTLFYVWSLFFYNTIPSKTDFTTSMGGEYTKVVSAYNENLNFLYIFRKMMIKFCREYTNGD